jgi:hypothetical protein
MPLIIMPTILPLLAVRKVDISMLIATVVARLPKIIEDTLIAIPINSNTTVIVHAHVFPFNNPKDTARYPIPTANMIAPIITKTKPVIYDINKDPTATPPIPAKSDRIPPIIIKIAITVTPVGRLFISKSSTLSEGINIHIYFDVYITQEIHRYLSGFGILSMFTAKIL